MSAAPATPTKAQSQVLEVGRKHGPPTPDGNVNVNVMVKAFSGKKAREALVRNLKQGINVTRYIGGTAGSVSGMLSINATADEISFTAHDASQGGKPESIKVPEFVEVREGLSFNGKDFESFKGLPKSKDSLCFSILSGSPSRPDHSLDLVCDSKELCSELVDNFRHLMNKNKNIVKLKGLDSKTCDVAAVRRIFHGSHSVKHVTFDRDGTARIMFENRKTAKAAMSEMHDLQAAIREQVAWTKSPKSGGGAAGGFGAGGAAGGGTVVAAPPADEVDIDSHVTGQLGGMHIADDGHHWDDDDGLHIAI